MLELLEPTVLSVLKVPPEPNPPAGEAGSLQVFRASPQYFTYRRLAWALRQLATGAALIGGVVFLTIGMPNIEHGGTLAPWLRLAEAFATVLFLVQLPFSYALLQLDYRMRWYMVTDRSLRVREGLVSLKEKTMTFANVQQLSVEQGPLQRLLGIADVKVQSAGGGAGHGAHGGQPGMREGPHEARFRGVNNASEIRDLIRERVRRYRDAGLGDTDDHPAVEETAHPGEAADLAAARELLEEVKGLRAALNAPLGA